MSLAEVLRGGRMPSGEVLQPLAPTWITIPKSVGDFVRSGTTVYKWTIAGILPYYYCLREQEITQRFPDKEGLGSDLRPPQTITRLQLVKVVPKELIPFILNDTTKVGRQALRAEWEEHVAAGHIAIPEEFAWWGKLHGDSEQFKTYLKEDLKENDATVAVCISHLKALGVWFIRKERRLFDPALVTADLLKEFYTVHKPKISPYTRQLTASLDDFFTYAKTKHLVDENPFKTDYSLYEVYSKRRARRNKAAHLQADADIRGSNRRRRLNLSFKEKQKRYKDIKTNPDKEKIREKIEWMKQQGRKEATIAELYFEGQSIKQIAKSMQLHPKTVGLNLAALLHVVGILTYTDKTILKFAGWLARSIESQEVKHSKAERERAERAKAYAVGGEVPPTTLRTDLWGKWQRAMRALGKDPDCINRLPNRLRIALTLGLQMNYQVGNPTSFAEVATKIERLGGNSGKVHNRQRVSQLIDEALALLEREE